MSIRDLYEIIIFIDVSYLFLISSLSLISNVNAYEIPGWMKSNAEWWAQDQIDDEAFVSGIEFLIQEEIIQISDTTSSTTQGSEEIPGWIKNNADWWSQGLISDDDFIKGIEYLVESGIVVVSQSLAIEPISSTNLTPESIQENSKIDETLSYRLTNSFLGDNIFFDTSSGMENTWFINNGSDTFRNSHHLLKLPKV